MPASTHKAIADAAAAMIVSLGAPVTGFAVVVRSQIYRIDGDPNQLVIVTMGSEHDRTLLTGNGILRAYEIVVTVLASGNQKLEAGIGTAKGVREEIRQGLIPDTTTARPFIAAVPSVYDVIAEDIPEEDPAAFASNYQTARLALVYLSSESIRGS